MSLAIDHAVFGNGWGLGSPFFDQRFYWLVDTKEGREHGKGRLYFMGRLVRCATPELRVADAAPRH